ncbi:hypothetical protein [Oscillatoria sp. FACHB-1406]|uniref:hypothetical protein n=1 Tax=Oscillatoria sp. FACHB-1406 TaxID=2692846 RepID=UPI00168A3D27|nr:hypothetical protein [Oscillatoria sp. FACHB-1406]MBD2577931.1 hypothetical protein [Oscillatoria sp. FACHB-1406]
MKQYSEIMVKNLLFSTAAIATFSISWSPAVFANPTESLAASSALRSRGAAGVAEFIQQYRDRLDDPQVRLALDKICQQRDCYASQLYWYTDLEAAKAEAKATGKPILSLRLLGRLDEDLSCANSRFFRVALYPNAEISKVLRDRYILHWQSVRPVPQVTIDFGDGRQLKRTLTGNSIHYILDSDGRVLDALPGMYGPQAFLQHLERAETLDRRLQQLPESDRADTLRQYYRDRVATLQNDWQADLSQLGIQPPSELAPLPAEIPTAAEAGRLAVSKMMVEAPLLNAIASSNRERLNAATEIAGWEKLAQLRAADSRLDENSRALMRAKNPRTWEMQIGQEDALAPVVERFEMVMAIDTIRNQYLLQPQIYQWLLDRPNFANNLDTLNAQVYDRLFLTPNSDPWLGLLLEDEFTAIDNQGAI